MKKVITIAIIVAVIIAISIIAIEQSMNEKETIPSSNLPINTPSNLPINTPSTPPAGKVIKLNLTESLGIGSH